MAKIDFRGNTYRAERGAEPTSRIEVRALFRFNGHSAVKDDDRSAITWLCDHGLKKSKATKLLADLSDEARHSLGDGGHPSRFHHKPLTVAPSVVLNTTP